MSTVVRVRGRGGPEVLQLEQREPPRPRARQVRIAVEAAGVAYGDVMRRCGVLAPPGSFTPGYDVVGRIEALGSRVQGWAEGQRVAAMMPGPGFGGYAEHVVVAARRLAPVPEELEATTAVALGLNYITAHQLITRIAGLERGQRLLVHGAAGGVGTAALELGARLDLELYGTASAAKHDHLRAHGCSPIDYRSEDFVVRIGALAPPGVDAVFDGIGGAHWLRSADALRADGILVGLGVSGDVDGGMIAVTRGIGYFARLRLRRGMRARLYGITQTPGTSWDTCRDDWAQLLELGARGELKPQIARVLPLEQVQEAHRLLDQRAVIGKIVLVCA